MEKEFWSLKDVADLFRVNQETVRRWILRKKIPAIKFGGNWRISDRVIQQIKDGVIQVK